MWSCSQHLFRQVSAVSMVPCEWSGPTTWTQASRTQSQAGLHIHAPARLMTCSPGRLRRGAGSAPWPAGRPGSCPGAAAAPVCNTALHHVQTRKACTSMEHCVGPRALHVRMTRHRSFFRATPRGPPPATAARYRPYRPFSSDGVVTAQRCTSPSSPTCFFDVLRGGARVTPSSA